MTAKKLDVTFAPKNVGRAFWPAAGLPPGVDAQSRAPVKNETSRSKTEGGVWRC